MAINQHLFSLKSLLYYFLLLLRSCFVMFSTRTMYSRPTYWISFRLGHNVVSSWWTDWKCCRIKRRVTLHRVAWCYSVSLKAWKYNFGKRSSIEAHISVTSITLRNSILYLTSTSLLNHPQWNNFADK